MVIPFPGLGRLGVFQKRYKRKLQENIETVLLKKEKRVPLPREVPLFKKPPSLRNDF
jgi:hypothetical protein